ncbi:MAG: heme-binding protein [SAR86 cluster bacterium]|uniref:Heme-binding protein n=1 Tax=SAR86 cluster bacterium TaxID=2030880 RepID=A0A973A8I7_9GAMM|nr:heme-binding protein [SAR86 cluster bacterium]
MLLKAAKYHAIDDLPVPFDAAVNIDETAGQVFAMLRPKRDWQLARYLQPKYPLIAQLEQKWQKSGEQTWASDNSPFMPYLLRTNEILIPVEPR